MPPKRFPVENSDSPLGISQMSTKSESQWQHKLGVDYEKTFGKEMTNICYLHSEFLKYDKSKIRKNIHKIFTREVLYNKMIKPQVTALIHQTIFIFKRNYCRILQYKRTWTGGQKFIKMKLDFDFCEQLIWNNVKFFMWGSLEMPQFM